MEWGRWRQPHTCVHAHENTWTCKYVYGIIGNSPAFPQWGQPFARDYHVYSAYMCVHAYVCMYMYIHTCMGLHPATHTPSTHPHPKGAIPKMSRTNIDQVWWWGVATQVAVLCFKKQKLHLFTIVELTLSPQVITGWDMNWNILQNL